MDDAQRDRLVFNAVGHLKNGVTEPLLEYALQYWRNIDKEIGFVGILLVYPVVA